MGSRRGWTMHGDGRTVASGDIVRTDERLRMSCVLGPLPKFGAIIGAIPIGVLGGAVTVLFGMIAVPGARSWIEARVSFRDPVTS